MGRGDLDDLRIIVGASSQDYPGWIRTQQADLDLLRRDDWSRRFMLGSVTCVLAEHVWEHLDPDHAYNAARLCFDFLRPGGWVRCAVPDGCFPDPAYQRLVQVGGPGPADHPAASHKVVYRLETLQAVFSSAGFEVCPLEWWDEQGRFHEETWDERDGFVYRSRRYDHRNLHGKVGFTSLLVDAVKPINQPLA
jgi:predicted SAM-dependent methyltransferase